MLFGRFDRFNQFYRLNRSVRGRSEARYLLFWPKFGKISFVRLDSEESPIVDPFGLRAFPANHQVGQNDLQFVNDSLKRNKLVGLFCV